MVHSMKTLINSLVVFLLLAGCSNSSDLKPTSSSNPHIIDGYYYHNIQKTQIDSSIKTLDLGPFKIETPTSWKFERVQGIDSYVGKIKKDSTLFHFDFSSMGYSNSLSRDTFQHNITTDTIPPYFVKIISPKKGHLGQTGIYLNHLKTSLTLNFYSTDSLDPQTQKEALEIINSIGIVVN